MSQEERRNYYADVEYQMWRWGGNPDLVDRDRLDDYRDQGLNEDEAARLERERQRPLPAVEGEEVRRNG